MNYNCKIQYTLNQGIVSSISPTKFLNKNVISVDVGNHAQGGILGAITEGEAVLEKLNKIKFNVTIIGNHEFDYGIDHCLN